MGKEDGHHATVVQGVCKRETVRGAGRDGPLSTLVLFYDGTDAAKQQLAFSASGSSSTISRPSRDAG
jgi:hypothetical protein